MWKAAWVPELEDLLCARLARPGGPRRWQVWAELDDVLTDLAEDADRRLASQTRHALRG